MVFVNTNNNDDSIEKETSPLLIVLVLALLALLLVSVALILQISWWLDRSISHHWSTNNVNQFIERCTIFIEGILEDDIYLMNLLDSHHYSTVYTVYNNYKQDHSHRLMQIVSFYEYLEYNIRFH